MSVLTLPNDRSVLLDLNFDTIELEMIFAENSIKISANIQEIREMFGDILSKPLVNDRGSIYLDTTATDRRAWPIIIANQMNCI
jgi:hypothetical protein